MQRRRELAASPARSAAETWRAVIDLVSATLDRSPHLDGSSVRKAMEKLAPAGIALVAAGHLERQPLTLIASPLALDISTVSGEKAFDVLNEESSDGVGGAATATVWTVHLPRPEGLADLIDEVVNDVEQATTDGASEAATSSASTQDVNDVVDLRRLGAGG